MKKIDLKNKEILFYIISFIIITILFFTHFIYISYDSSEYIGMSLAIGTNTIKDVWNTIRGISFPLLLRIFEPFKYQNKYLFLLMLYLFYILMIYLVINIGKKIKLYNNKNDKFLYLLGIFIFIIFNPFIFMYYHVILTEFIIMTLNILFIYLSYNYINFNINKDKKYLIIYSFIISLLITFCYHTKQSFLGMLSIEMLIVIILSIIKYHDWKNILARIFTCIICTLMLVSSIKLWNNFMAKESVGNNVGTAAVQSYTNKHLLGSLKLLTEVGNNTNIVYTNNKFLIINTNKEIKINKNTKEIINILNHKSKYKGFTIYEYDNIQYIFYTKNNYSLKEQIPMYLKILFTHPKIILKSYYNSFIDIVWTNKSYHSESFEYIDYYYKSGSSSSLYYNRNYYEAVKKLIETPKRSFIDKFAFGLSIMICYLYKINQLILPLLFIISIIMYIVFVIKDKKNKKYKLYRNGFEMIVLLYGMAFGCILSYVIFGALIDRYIIPSLIPMFVGDIVFIIYISKIIKERVN